MSDLSGDMIAALTLAAIAIPEQMATARLGGFPPLAGFWVFVAGSAAFAVFGATPLLSSGADSTITPIFAGSLAAFAAFGSTGNFALAALLALLVGALVVASGLLRLGWIANLLSVPVTTGFLLGIAVHIAGSQLPALLGLTLPHADLFATLRAVAENIGKTNLPALGLGVGTFAVIFIGERINARIPAAIIALVLATLAVLAFGLAARGTPVLGVVAGGPPRFAVPAVTLGDVGRLVPLAFIIAVVILIQTAATARSFARSPGGVDVNLDFVGVGLGSLVAGFLGGFPVNASPPRTAVATESGGRSPLCNLAAAAIVALFALVGMRALASVPESALAGLLFFVAQRIVRISVIAAAFRETKAEFALVLVTAAAIVVEPIATGVAIGIVLSVVHGLWTITRARAIPYARVPGTTIWWPRSAIAQSETVPGIAVVGFQAPLFFLNAETFEHDVLGAIAEKRPDAKLVILEANSIVEIDFSAAQVLVALIERLKQNGIALYVARLESLRAVQALERFGVMEKLGRDCVFHSVQQAVDAWEQEHRA